MDGTHGSAVVGLFGCKIQPRNATPKPVWNPDLRNEIDFDSTWVEVPDTEESVNGFRAQWEEFIRHVVADTEHRYDFLAGARGMLLAEKGLESHRTGARIDLPEISADRVPDTVEGAETGEPARTEH
ncbi:hypothetical protein GCM10025876_10200 [Demequina litorisediminis]|uniref:Gfo/Idh/MocA-like oxidoreductase C-terminal domain-containing protein n=1 Tax=Demequina litorisediminis TaxID=1849022 RepID=A0ABQ6IC24_9MICO|nr:hypothetical protein GCM10025876_10200 [Demequina litorisediminis]